MLRELPLIAIIGLAACSGTAPPSGNPTPAPPSPPIAGAPPAASPAVTLGSGPTVPSAASAPSKTPPKAPAIATTKALKFTRVRSGAMRSFALGHDGRAATLEKEPWLYDGKAWKELPMPDKLRTPGGANDDVDIFFGRDNRPRIMGRRTTGSEVTFVYLRYKFGWREGHKEIGSLANKPRAGLFGVLGHDDPEVVCKIGDQCIIKRLTGWTIFETGPGVPHVVVAQKSAWALHPKYIAQVGKKGWNKLPAPPFQDPRGLWADPKMTLYATSGDSIFHQRGQNWGRRKAPVTQPRALWGTDENDIWVVGDDGAGHFDGKEWRKVDGVEGPLSMVLGRGDEVWLGGASGLWRGSGPRQ